MNEPKNLDALVSPARPVTLGGETFVLPGDMPLEIHLRVQQGLTDDDDLRGANTLRDAIHHLFSWNPNLEGPDPEAYARAVPVLRSLGLRSLLALVNGAYGDEEDEIEEIEEDLAASPLEPETTSTTTGDSPNGESPIQSSTVEVPVIEKESAGSS